MAKTNFAALTANEYKLWAMDFWKVARNASFINQFAGTGPNSMVQRITELKKSAKGAQAVITLIPDLTGDGVIGDNTLEDNEEEIKSLECVIRIDQLRNANRIEGRMADQKSIVDFRKTSRDVLAYWMADRLDQLAFLSLSGVTYDTRLTGEARTPVVGNDWTSLDYAADVAAPSVERGYRWDATSGLLEDTNTNLEAADKLSYRTIVDLKALAKTKYIKGIKGPGNEEIYHMFVTPQGMATLKLDSDFIQNVRHAGVRGGKNPLFAGSSSVMVDGVYIHEFRHVYNTTGLASGSKWGATGTVEGQRALFCGAQALGFADIGTPYWVEDVFDYENELGISVGKIFGFLKPQFLSNYCDPANAATKLDFGVISLDTAI